MAGLPIRIQGGVSGGGCTRISFFLKLNTLLSHQTALVDLDGGAIGFLRVSWDPTEYIMAEAACQGGSGFVTLWPPSTSPPVNQWIWITAIMGSDITTGVFKIAGEARTRTDFPGGQSGTFAAGPGGGVSASLGWGVPISSTYNPFPNALGDEMTELCIETFIPNTVEDIGGRSMPSQPIDLSSDPDRAHIVALYHCDVPLGANQAIKDATANHFDLAPGSANGDLIIHDSPF